MLAHDLNRARARACARAPQPPPAEWTKREANTHTPPQGLQAVEKGKRKARKKDGKGGDEDKKAEGSTRTRGEEEWRRRDEEGKEDEQAEKGSKKMGWGTRKEKEKKREEEHDREQERPGERPETPPAPPF
eukprot:364776-Chlamydomonas_euryale.AAC.8